MQPKAKLRKDYRAPDFTITDIYLDFQLDPDRTFVTSKLTVVRKNPEATTLRLDGHSFDFLSLKYNGEPFSAFQKDDESLTLNLADVPAERFELEIETALNPAQKHLVTRFV
ncbi:Aminopeptidase N [Mannheimia haemolytica]|uniref:Aminopeptidase N n=1 Tax=Mannheimia haemolytica TaxID=75985 RepID=A0A378MW08_MANHA|nr:Aminopeptidase N [Mannheimia haemolytica]